MITREREQIRAERFSEAVDLLVHGSEAQPEQLAAADAELLEIARRFAALPRLLGPVAPCLEQQIVRQSRAGVTISRRASRRRLLLAAASMVAVFLLAASFTPAGQTAVAGLRAVFRLGDTEVQIEPDMAPLPQSATAVAGGTAIQESLTLAQAQQQAAFAIAQPQELPVGYWLQAVHSYTYPDLPSWVPQPIFVELVYGDGQGKEMVLRVYSIALGEEASISGLNLQAEDIQSAQDVDVNDSHGVLLRLRAPRTGLAWYEVVWEQDELILALSSLYLTQDDLVRIARSVR
jgi:hypothetical protein